MSDGSFFSLGTGSRPISVALISRIGKSNTNLAALFRRYKCIQHPSIERFAIAHRDQTYDDSFVNWILATPCDGEKHSFARGHTFICRASVIYLSEVLNDASIVV